MIRLLCYLISAISFAFPPASFLFEDFKVTHCNFVLKIDSVPAWTHETTSSAKVCKAPSLIALFQETAVSDVCLLKEEPKALFVINVPSKDLFVKMAPLPIFPVPPVCQVSAGICKSIPVMDLFINEVVCCAPGSPFCPVSSLSPLSTSDQLSSFNPFSFFADGKSFTSTVKDLFQNLMVVIKKLSLYRPSRFTMIVFVLTLIYCFLFQKVRKRRLRGPCPYSFC
ncbi:hypothetical protein BD770DRAFT_400777 [Pilaira anomala]|nr:hypothetical protein BD770DRAFT_400777 [Pilaira anomala]